MLSHTFFGFRRNLGYCSLLMHNFTIEYFVYLLIHNVFVYL